MWTEKNSSRHHAQASKVNSLETNTYKLGTKLM